VTSGIPITVTRKLTRLLFVDLWTGLRASQHLRNFAAEEPKRRLSHELGPKQTARDVLGHLHPGDKVAVISRFSRDRAQPYLDAIEERGLRARFIEGQTGVQDFCFLLHSQKEMIGISHSTFFLWAGYLSNCPHVIAYTVNSKQRRQTFGDEYVYHNHTNPILADRFTFPVIKPVKDPEVASQGCRDGSSGPSREDTRKSFHLQTLCLLMTATLRLWPYL
jgi:hypothetical protein